MNNSGRVKSSKKNIIYGIICLIVNTLLTFISRTLFIKILSAEYLGVNGLFSNIFSLLSLSELGLSSAAVYSLYKPIAEDNKKKVNQLVNYYSKLFIFVFILMTSLGLLLLPLLPYIVHTTISIKEIRIFYLLYLFISSVSYLAISKQFLLTADQRDYIIKRITLIFVIIQKLLQILVLYLTKNYYLFILVQVICTIILNIFLVYKANKIYPFLHKDNSLPKKEKNKILSKTKDLFLYKLSNTTIGCTDNFYISILLGTIVVGYYSNYLMIIAVLATLINTLIFSISSSIGNYNVTENNSNKIKLFYEVLFVIQWVVGFMSCGLLLSFNDLINIWIGKEYLLGIIPVIIIVMNFYIDNITSPVWIYREAMGLFSEVKKVMLSAAVINLILSFILGKLFGLSGILISTLISRLLTVVWYEPIILIKNKLESNVKDYYITQIKYILLFFIVTIIIYLITKPLIVNNLLLFILKVLIITITYNITYLIIFKNNNNFKSVLNKLLKR